MLNPEGARSGCLPDMSTGRFRDSPPLPALQFFNLHHRGETSICGSNSRDNQNRTTGRSVSDCDRSIGNHGVICRDNT